MYIKEFPDMIFNVQQVLEKKLVLFLVCLSLIKYDQSTSIFRSLFIIQSIDDKQRSATPTNFFLVLFLRIVY